MRRVHCFLAPLAGALLASISACSLTVARADECTSNVQCRQAFGWGSVCGEQGFCEAAAAPERCSRTTPEDLFEAPAKYKDAWVVGALFAEDTHLDSIQATDLAIKEANEAGGLDGWTFAGVYCDYGESFDDGLDSLEASAEGALWLADTLGVSAIIGPRGSSRTEAAFVALDGRDVLVISPSATSPELTGLDETSPTDENPGLLWRTAAPDTAQATAIVDDLDARGVTSLVIIAQSGAYGDGLAGLIDEEFTGEVTIQTYAGSPFGAVADAAGAGADEVAFISSDIEDYIDFFDGAVASDNLRDTYDAMGIFLPDAAFNVQLLDGVSSDATILFDNVRGTRYPPSEGPLFDTFSAAYATEYDENPESSGFTVHTYDAAWLVVYATAWAFYNESDGGGRSLARGLRHMSSGPTVSIRFSGWDQVVQAFMAGDSIDVEGGSGSLDYDPATEETTAPTALWGIVEPSPGAFEFDDL